MDGLITKGQSAISRSIKPLLGSLTAVALTTVVLLFIDARLQPRHLIMGYLLPITLIAIQYGSMFAFLAAALSGGAAAYFLLAPKYSFNIADPLHIAELGFFLLLALIAAKITALLTYDRRNARQNSPTTTNSPTGNS